MAAKRPAYKAKQTMPEKVIKNKTSKYKFIKVLKRNKICQIQLDRPDFLNAMNIEMAQEITDTLIDVEMDRKILAVVLCGNERAFCAGADLSRMKSKKNELFDVYRSRFNHMPNRILYQVLCYYTKPVISAVEGYCLGGGFEIAMWGDFIVAGEEAQFGLPEVRHSLIPGGGGTQNLPRLIGPGLAKELIWTGRRITAQEAKEYGIVNHVVPKGTALKKAREIVGEMEQNGPLGIMMSKQAINRGLDQSRFNGFLAEGDLAHMLNFSEDRPEGLKAFAERRKPKFKGQ